MLDVQLPLFPGFYYSYLSDAFDNEESNYIYNMEEDGRKVDPEKLFEHTNYKKAYQYLAKSWVEYFSELSGFELVFDEMVSPREYNFTTDRVFAKVSEKTVKQWFKISKANKHERLREVIKDHFTSYSGFHSHYSNDLETWLKKPVTKWDHNELSALLEAVIEPGLDKEIFDDLVGNGEICNAWEAGVDWSKENEFCTPPIDNKE